MALKAAKVGDWARIDAPYGAFTFEGEYPKIALLAGGIGVTPFMSICKNATDKAFEVGNHAFPGLPHPRRCSFQAGTRSHAASEQELEAALGC